RRLIAGHEWKTAGIELIKQQRYFTRRKIDIGPKRARDDFQLRGRNQDERIGDLAVVDVLQQPVFDVVLMRDVVQRLALAYLVGDGEEMFAGINHLAGERVEPRHDDFALIRG